MINTLKISIITAVYNGEKYLEQTILSIINQSYKNIEHIIVDGESEDNTHSILDKYKGKIDHIIIKRDNSMYEAINRGILTASGDYIMVLNSDDYLADSNTITKVVNFIRQNPNFLAYYGNIVIFEKNKFHKRKVYQINRRELLYTQHCTHIPHPALFVNREWSLKNVGLYDLNYRYASDFDYILRLLANCSAKHMDIYISVFRMHDRNITSSGKIDRDRLHILQKYDDGASKFIKYLCYFFNWSKYKLLNIVINIS